MRHANRSAKVNVKVLVILILVIVGLGVSLVVARQVRRNILSERDFEAGTAAFEKGDWLTAYKHLQEYLGRNPDDIEILKKYAQARLAVRPVEPGHIGAAVGAYRRAIQLDPLDEVPYDKLATIYAATGNFEDLAYIAGKRLEHDPNDVKASLWLSEALMRLNRTAEARDTLTSLIERLEADPEDHIEYVQACAQMSSIEATSNLPEAMANTLGWLNKAVDRFPQSADALASRARFYRLADLPGADEPQRRQLARQDLIAADEQGTNDARTRLFLAREWMAHGEFDKVAAELEAADRLPEATIAERYFDPDMWIVDRFDVVSELALRRGTFAEGAALAGATLEKLESKGHRLSVFPNAIRLYVGAGGEENISKAAEGLKEYEETLYVRQKATEAKLELAFLKALVARGRGDSYAVIDALQPVVTVGTSYAELWRLLAEAFSRTDQTRRAVDAMRQYLRLRPRDFPTMFQLTREYLRLQDWTRAFETAQLGHRLNPSDVSLNVLRIEAGIRIAAEQQGSPDSARLRELDAELADLRKDEKNAKRADIRILQAVIGVHMAQSETDAAAKEQKLADVEKGLRLAIEQCDEPLGAEMQLVRLYFQQKQTAKALEKCRAACSRHPDLAEPWLSLAGLYVADNDPNSAIRSLEEAAKTVVAEPGQRSITTRRALLELMHGDRAAGMALLADVAANDPREIRARALLLDVREVQADQARTEALIKQLEEAEGQSGLTWRLYRASTWLSSDQWRSKQQGIVDLLQYCMDADPEATGPPLLMAQLYEKLGDAKRVEEICRQALVRNPSATAIADKLVTLLEGQNRLSDAEAIRQQVEADPRVVSAWNVNAAVRARDFSRAIDELRLRISNDPRDVQSRVLLARLLYWQMHDAGQALALLDEAEAIASPSLPTVGVRAAILKAEGHADQAQQVVDQYVASKDDFSAHLMRASYRASQGQWELAEADYKKLTTFPDKDQRSTGYALLSDFYARQGRVDEVIATLEEGLKAHRDDLALQRMLMRRLFLRAQGQDRDKALAMLGALERELPQDLDLMMVRARELLRQGDPQSIQAAKGKLEAVVKLAPTTVEAHLALIDLAMRSEQYEAARDYAIRAMGANPKHPALLSARGRAEVVLGNAQIATELARLALAEDPNHAGALGVLVDAALAMKDENLLKEAVRSVHKIREADPNRTDAIGIIVGRAVNSRDPTLLDEAKGLIEAELVRVPSDERLLLAHAQVLVALGSPAQAIPGLTAYCLGEEGRASLDAIVMLADLHRIHGDLEQAYAWIERASQVAPESQTVVHARFLCLASQERWDELAGISAAYIACTDQNPATVTRAAGVLVSLDTAALQSEGVKLFEHAVRLWPMLADARLGLASALYRTGDVVKAKRTYQELLEQYPNNMQILNDLAWILQEQDRDYAAALDLANKGLSLKGADTDRRHLLDTRGTILSKMTDRLSDAKTDFEELVKLTDPGSPRRAKALLNLARVCAKLGDIDQAKKHLTEAVEIDRASPVFTPEERAEAEGLLK